MNDLNALQLFLTLMQTCSTQRTATKLGRSQSYVSKVLAQLREELNDPLFVRSSEGLSPTSYALSIEPKLRRALDQVTLSLEPEDFNPENVDKVCLHLAEPYLVRYGKKIIQEIRRQSKAVIEIRTWTNLSESMILEEEVDIGLHTLSDKPQTLYQKRMHSGVGGFEGNQEGDYIKFVVSGLNDHTNFFQLLTPEVDVGICVDNFSLMQQLMDIGYTLRYRKSSEAQEKDSQLNIQIALIVKASRRDSGKIHWLTDLVSEIING